LPRIPEVEAGSVDKTRREETVHVLYLVEGPRELDLDGIVEDLNVRDVLFLLQGKIRASLLR
jgi:hypothetical protein